MILAQDVSKHFDDVEAVKNVSVTIKKGEVFGLIGTNGAGKSTFLRMVSGVLKPDHGTIRIDEKEVYENPVTKGNLFYISDDQYYAPTTTPEEGMQFYKLFYKDFDTNRFMKMLDQFGLDKKRKISTFSK